MSHIVMLHPLSSLFNLGFVLVSSLVPQIEHLYAFHFSLPSLFPLRFDSGGYCPGPNCLGRVCSGSALQPQVTDPPRKGVLKGTMATWGWLPPCR